MSGNLYLIPSPIGNMKDVSPRVQETLLLCDYIACEDTRNTLKLLNILGIRKKCVSCHEHNELKISPSIIEDLKNGKNIGYLSDAGYPCISDPGHLLAKEAINNNITVVPLSGASAFLNALVGSGIDPSKFLFYGFLNSKSEDRKKELNNLKEVPFTVVFYESPHRIDKTLEDIYEVFGNRKITIARELTKIHEEFIRSTLKDLVEEKREYIGEMVLIINKYTASEEVSEELSDEEITKYLNTLLNNGVSSKDAITSLALLKKTNKNRIKAIYYSLNKDKN
ncbi:MAG: 16S rRNA (cytidine(1402)-2'-O)-methyltransferase [Erysipelotrichaceae bacterium]|jgi:16S rRNA (cytidine1402-2'-O)-methyltransferase|nr:16S rRNA (cytidine(1402)-2'-O)-methyltransferase [Erysipelotrichaceae bacterium]